MGEFMAITKEEAEAMVSAAVSAAVTPLQAKLDAIETSPAPKNAEPPAVDKIFTKAELRELIDQDQITEAQAEDRLELQREQRIRAAIRADMEQLAATKTDGAQIDEFQALVPELADRSSNEYLRVKAQFEKLLKRGQPKTPSTELTALEMIYGPVDKLRIAKSSRTETEYHEDAGGDGTSSATPLPKDIKFTADEKRYYGDLMSKGMYKDWDEVRAELAYANNRVREKHGARVH